MRYVSSLAAVVLVVSAPVGRADDAIPSEVLAKIRTPRSTSRSRPKESRGAARVRDEGRREQHIDCYQSSRRPAKADRGHYGEEFERSTRWRGLPAGRLAAAALHSSCRPLHSARHASSGPRPLTNCRPRSRRGGSCGLGTRRRPSSCTAARRRRVASGRGAVSGSGIGPGRAQGQRG